jgi:succinate dehydrogenase/fumarate reductase flavoprotein subunit|tara:strand:+ start:15595 stop:15996 length:402 start_codon:yes stop_codon:yes gene_type:complete
MLTQFFAAFCDKSVQFSPASITPSGTSSLTFSLTSTMSEQIIVIGGGLAGLSAAHTVLEHGGRVLLLDKCPFLGGNSTKATSGINGAPTRTQAAKGIMDTADKFEADIIKGAAGVGHTTPPEHTVPLAKVRLC